MRKYKEYVEDSTRGRALMQPKTFKGDVLVQVWMDSRVLATVSKWLDDEGHYTRFMSEVLKEGMAALCDTLLFNDKVEMIESTIDAREMLQRKYRINLNPDNRGSKNAQHNMILSERTRGMNTRRTNTTTMREGSSADFSEENIAYHVAQADKRIAKERREMAAKADRDVEEYKKNTEIDPATGTYVLPKNPVKDKVPEEEVVQTVMPEVKTKPVESDRLRPMNQEELNRTALELEKSDREYTEKLKNM